MYLRMVAELLRQKYPVGNVRNQSINREFRQKYPVGNAENRISTGVLGENALLGMRENRISTGSLDKNALLERGKFEYQQEVKTLRMPLFLYA